MSDLPRVRVSRVSHQGNQRAGAGGRVAFPFLIEDLLGFAGDPFVLARSGTERSSEGVVEGAVEAAVGIGGGNDGVDLEGWIESSETGIVVVDLGFLEEFGVEGIHGILECVGVFLEHAEEMESG